MSSSRPVALVTGSGGALGSEMCKQFLDDGYDVVVSDLREDAAQEVAKALDPKGEHVFTVSIDVGSTESVDAGIAKIIERFGRLDVLVNNAGNFRQGLTHTYSDEDWRFITNVHLDGAFRCCRAAYPHLKKSPYPTIISIASVAARIGLPGRLSYSVSKAGLEALTRVLAVEWAPDNIRVVAIAPGFTKTQNRIFVDGKEVTYESFAQAVPMKRMGRPEEQASVVVFLASQKASYINGQTIVVDGGATIDLRV
ncbi:MAG: SDR family oxidoreductase [Actinobacteria bacterium]|jgi:NAD(P)-dependent dehydrogenase (short-subunit alcohol dehydrogenase family)|nr:SDR family oxidoreductase [Actinomycetota bacterium]MTA37453.1 SDR family oxidoreductase [Actinomycetota bacterium]MTA48037.1 SDR family oxidoreductase [Actinomycetota bacterium]